MTPRVLSTLGNWGDIAGWRERVTSITLAQERSPGLWGRVRRVASEFADGVRIWWSSRNYDAIVTESRLHAAVYGALARLRLWPMRRHLMFECLWESPRGRLNARLKSLQFRLSLTPRSRGIVYARRERTAFAQRFALPAERLVFIPYHTTFPQRVPWERGTPPVDGRYLFAGGESQRDYRTLCDAVRGLDIQVVVALRNRDLLNGIALPPNVRIITTDHREFLRWMAHAYINVVPLQAGTLRSAGQQTFLNAMALGTVVVVTDDQGGADYIDNGTDGFLTPAGDSAALRAALQRVLAEAPTAKRLAAAAAQAGTQYSTKLILGICLDFLLSDAFDDPRTTEYLGHLNRAATAAPQGH